MRRNAKQNSTEVERLAVSAGEAAQMLGISERTLWAKTKDGTVPAKKLGGRILYPIESLRKFLDREEDGTP